LCPGSAPRRAAPRSVKATTRGLFADVTNDLQHMQRSGRIQRLIKLEFVCGLFKDIISILTATVV
jgi:hypothetical protein